MEGEFHTGSGLQATADASVTLGCVLRVDGRPAGCALAPQAIKLRAAKAIAGPGSMALLQIEVLACDLVDAVEADPAVADALGRPGAKIVHVIVVACERRLAVALASAPQLDLAGEGANLHLFARVGIGTLSGACLALHGATRAFKALAPQPDARGVLQLEPA